MELQSQQVGSQAVFRFLAFGRLDTRQSSPRILEQESKCRDLFSSDFGGLKNLMFCPVHEISNRRQVIYTG